MASVTSADWADSNRNDDTDALVVEWRETLKVNKLKCDTEGDKTEDFAVVDFVMYSADLLPIIFIFYREPILVHVSNFVYDILAHKILPASKILIYLFYSIAMHFRRDTRWY